MKRDEKWSALEEGKTKRVDRTRMRVPLKVKHVRGMHPRRVEHEDL